MGYEAMDFSEIEGVSPSFAEALYRRYRDNPDSVEACWRDFFASLEVAASGPSWKRDNWPIAETDDLTAGLDPLQMSLAPNAAAPAAPSAPAYSQPLPDADEMERAAGNSIRAMMLIRTYRVRGHLASDLDPLGLHDRIQPADLTPEFHGFAPGDLDKPVYLGGALGLESATVNEIVAILRENYCGPVGLEYMHINDLEERRFLQEKFEGKEATIQFTREG
ncbi:MAG: 2-oxoglutarate dehydrogenase E1 component, partial [Parasphingopyxis sp.]